MKKVWLSRKKVSHIKKKSEYNASIYLHQTCNRRIFWFYSIYFINTPIWSEFILIYSYRMMYKFFILMFFQLEPKINYQLRKLFEDE